MKVRLWHATVAGGLLGLLLGIVLEIARELHGNYITRKMIEESIRLGSDHVDTVDLLRPHAIPVASCVVVAAIFGFVHVIRSLDE